MLIEVLLFNSFDTELHDRVAEGWSTVSGTASFYFTRSIGLQASVGAAEHEARSRAEKI